MGDRMSYRKIWHWIRKYSVLLLSSFLIWSSFASFNFWGEVQAQSVLNTPRVTASVVIDGYELFEVGVTGNFSALDRVARIHEVIRAFINKGLKPDRDPPIFIATLNNSITLRLEDQHLVTVTGSDVLPGVAIEEQAKNWQIQLIQALRRAAQEREPEYLEAKRKIALQVLGTATILYILSWRLDLILRQRLRFSVEHEPVSGAISQQRSSHTVHHLLLSFGQIAIWLTALYYIAGLFPDSRQWRYDFIAYFNRPMIPFGDRECSILELTLLLGMFIALWFFVIWITDAFRKQVLAVTGADRGLQDTAIVLSRVSLLSFGLLLIMQAWGINLASFAVLVSALSVGIGFGLQNIANNFISGIIISFDRSMKVGDFIQLNELMGTVERIGARSTEIRTLDRVSIIIPNSRFLEQELVNWSHGNPVSRVKIPIGVAYGTEANLVRKVLLEVAHSHAAVLLNPEPQVWFRKFGDSSLDFELLIWIRDPQNQFKYINEINYKIYEAFEYYQIEIPFPQHEVHLNARDLTHFTKALHHSLTNLPSQSQIHPAIQTPTQNLTQSSTQNSVNNRSVSVRKYSHVSVQNSALTDSDIPTAISTPIAPKPRPASLTPVHESFRSMLLELVQQLRSPSGLQIDDHRYGLTVYPKTFLGSDLVNWLRSQRGLSEAEALDLGQALITHGFIHHVHDEHDFQNASLFYRFYEDENGLV